MSANGVPRGAAPQERPWRPLWWWFVIHGTVVSAWGLFALISPMRGAEGWLIDGFAYGVMLLLAGAQLIIQGYGWRRYGDGWLGIFLGGVVGMLFGAAVVVSALLGQPDVIFWIVIVFLAVEGTIFIMGTSSGLLFRNWGVLMGGIIYIALVVMLVLRFTIDQDFEILDPVWGALGLLYGFSMIAAAIQVRHNAITQGGQLG